VATAGIFLPGFIFVAVASLLINRIRNSPGQAASWMGKCGFIGIDAGVTIQIARTAILDPITILIALVSLFLLLRYKLNSTWLIAGGC